MDLLADFFNSHSIEYYTVLDYQDCHEINHGIIERESFTPRSIILFVIPYYAGLTQNLSIYAAARDYHLFIRSFNNELCQRLGELFPGSSCRGYGDHSPIDERHAALIGGLGILGENGLLINEKYGSYIFIADVITDIPAEKLGSRGACEIKRCHGCGACKRACPTGILRGEGTDCLSAITQRKGELTDEEVALMRKYNTVWGCDLCQSSCPYNKSPRLTPLKFFLEDRIECLDSDTLAAMNKEQFGERAFAWRGRKTIERNLKLLGY